MPVCRHPYYLFSSSACRHPYYSLFNSACRHPYYQLLSSASHSSSFLSVLPFCRLLLFLRAAHTDLPTAIPPACRTGLPAIILSAFFRSACHHPCFLSHKSAWRHPYLLFCISVCCYLLSVLKLYLTTHDCLFSSSLCSAFLTACYTILFATILASVPSVLPAATIQTSSSLLLSASTLTISYTVLASDIFAAFFFNSVSFHPQCFSSSSAWRHQHCLHYNSASHHIHSLSSSACRHPTLAGDLLATIHVSS
jgi:hypothetical protein